MLRPVRSAVALALAGVLGCSLLVDASDIDEGCGPERKLCDDQRCVGRDDPAFGCKLGVCDPCDLDHAMPACMGGECVVKNCLLGFGCDDCSKNVLTDVNNCGVCRRPCNVSVGERCRDGVCVSE